MPENVLLALAHFIPKRLQAVVEALGGSYESLKDFPPYSRMAPQIRRMVSLFHPLTVPPAPFFEPGRLSTFQSTQPPPSHHHHHGHHRTFTAIIICPICTICTTCITYIIIITMVMVMVVMVAVVCSLKGSYLGALFLKMGRVVQKWVRLISLSQIRLACLSP